MSHFTQQRTRELTSDRKRNFELEKVNKTKMMEPGTETEPSTLNRNKFIRIRFKFPYVISERTFVEPTFCVKSINDMAI